MKKYVLSLFFAMPHLCFAGTNEIWIKAKLISKDKSHITVLFNSKRAELPLDRLEDSKAVTGENVKVLLLNQDEVKKLF